MSEKLMTTDHHFELFKEHFGIYADMFGLHDWEIFFFHTKLENAFACLSTNGYMRDRCASVSLTTEWDERVELSDNAIIQDAKHEAIELLVEDLSAMARARFVTDDEIALARHVLVRRLEKIL